MCGLGESGKTLAHTRVLFQFSQRHERAERQSSRIERDAVETGNVFEIDKTNRTRRVVLHRRQQILPARNRSRRLVNVARRTSQHFYGVVDVRRIAPLKCFHFIRPRSAFIRGLTYSNSSTPSESCPASPASRARARPSH